MESASSKTCALPHPDFIRLIKLRPADDIYDRAESIFGSIIDVRLSEDPLYEAISYTWGKPDLSQTLFTPEGHVKITENLASALKRLRRRDDDRCLRADAVCINQNDVVDKSHQVGMMGSIYRSAYRVISWLGPEDDSTAGAMASLRRISMSADQYCVMETVHGVRRTEIFLGHTKATQEAFKELIKSTNFDELSIFYSKACFTRLWVVQEVALAHKAMLVCGPSEISYDEFAMGTAVLHSMLQTFSTTAGNLRHSTIRQAWDLIGTRLVFNRQQRQDISLGSETVEIHHKFWRPGWMAHKLLDNVKALSHDCLDPRDRIYALLSLKGDNDIKLDPDYSRSTSEVYAHFARAYLQSGDVRILNHAGIQRVIKRYGLGDPKLSEEPTMLRHNLPSWAPDWRIDRPYMTLGGSNRVKFSAATDLASNIKCDMQSLRIFVSSIILDSVDFCQGAIDIDAYADDTPKRATHDEARASIVGLKPFYEEHQGYDDVYVTGEDRLTAFARTNMADASYALAEGLFPNLRDSQGIIILWQLFEKLRIREDDSLELDTDVLFPDPPTSEPNSREETIRRIMTFMFAALKNRSFYITKCGYIGLGPSLTKPDDSVVLFAGSETPFILRRVGDDDFCLLGDSYLHGFMYGELLTDALKSRSEWLTIV